MQIQITPLYPNVPLSYAQQESHRRRMALLLCSFHNTYAYILVPQRLYERLMTTIRFTVVLKEKKRLPVMKQHMQFQMTGNYKTHQNEVHHYIATVCDLNTHVRSIPLYICMN